MSRLLSSIIALTLFATLGTLADAKSCHGPNGKFIKCPKNMAASMHTIKKDKNGKCHLPNGKFTKCPK